MNRNINFKVEDFLRDDEFICYALNISSEAFEKWKSLLKEYSELTKDAELAKAILRGEERSYTLPPLENEALKQRILDDIH